MKKHLVTLKAIYTAEAFAKACRDYHETWYNRCPVGLFLECPFNMEKPCKDVTAHDWKAVMEEKPEEDNA